jgi:hypothetical protein
VFYNLSRRRPKPLGAETPSMDEMDKLHSRCSSGFKVYFQDQNIVFYNLSKKGGRNPING